jgi:8-oxo-dGTP pyrophosphatase MutT (NUDIX family)
VNPDDIRARLRRLSEDPRMHLREISGLEDLFGEMRPAAVLVPLTERGGEMVIVLTKRAEDLRKHSGEISFPGGRADEEDDDLIQTALRESHEEIALRPDDVHVYGALMQMPTVTGYDVTVFVGEFDQPYDLDPNPFEIDELIEAPLAAFMDESIHTVDTREWNGIEVPIHFYDYEGYNVWGATAFMLNTLLNFLKGDT